MDWQGWFFDFEEAIAEARHRRKPVFAQFHREKCSGCKKMYAVTYPDANVQTELHDWFVPLRLDILKDRLIRARYNAVWTPSFYFLDYNGKMYDNLQGYLTPEDFRIVLRLGLAAYYIPRGMYQKAIELLEQSVDQFPHNPRTPALLFKLGMAIYLSTWDNREFREIMSEIRQNYPDSPEARMWPWMED